MAALDGAGMTALTARRTSCCCRLWRYRIPCCCCKLPLWCCVTTIYVALTPVVYFLTHFMMYPGIILPAPTSFSDICPTCVEFEFHSARGGSIPALRYSPNASLPGGAGTPVLLLGGNGMNQYTNMVYMTQLLPSDVAWDFYSISYPQYPPREGGWLSEAETIEDARELMAYIKQATGKASVVFGWSLGTAVAAAASVGSPEDTRCVVLGNPFTNMWLEGIVASRGLLAPWVYVSDTWRTKNRVGSLKKPTIVLSSTRDQMIPVFMHTAVYDSVAAQHKLLIERSTGHMGFEAFEGQNASLARTLRRWCADGPKLRTSMLVSRDSRAPVDGGSDTVLYH